MSCRGADVFEVHIWSFSADMCIHVHGGLVDVDELITGENCGYMWILVDDSVILLSRMLI